MRVIGADGSQVGIIPTHEALRLAEEQGLELVEVNPRAAPPVCKIMDFGKFKYETSKKEKASRKHQSTIVLKEIKLRPKTDKHDLDFKVEAHPRRSSAEGNKCKLVIVFRGREIVHPETGQAMLDRVVKTVADIAMVEQRPMMEGRRMVMIIGPRVGVIRPPVGGPLAAASARRAERRRTERHLAAGARGRQSGAHRAPRGAGAAAAKTGAARAPRRRPRPRPPRPAADRAARRRRPCPQPPRAVKRSGATRRDTSRQEVAWRTRRVGVLAFSFSGPGSRLAA